MADPLPANLPLSLLTVLEPVAPLVSDWIIVVICLVLVAFFAGMEIAFISASRLRIQLRSKDGQGGGKWLGRYIKKPNEFISTVLVGTNLAMVIYGLYMGGILEEALDALPYPWLNSGIIRYVIVTFVSTLIILVLAEYIPKTLFRMYADTLLFGLAGVFRVAQLLMWPMIVLTKEISSFLLRWFTKAEINEATPVFSKVDLDNYLASLENSHNSENLEIDTEVFRNALDFSDVRVKDFMVPRPEIQAVVVTESLEVLRAKFIETAHSKLLVYRETVDHVIGFVHHSDLFHSPKNIQEILRPVLFVNEALQAHDMLRNFIQERRSLAVVVDEFGGTAGMVTIEDVLEQIVGEIEDEFDVEDQIEQVIGDKHYRFSARLEVDYLNEKYPDLRIPEGEYSTLGGYILHAAERIPFEGESLVFENFHIVVKKTTGARIEEVELRVIAELE
ncbi:MAG: hemolysin family protein [Bacteroidota bacterium]|jgi:putative hemolysin